MTTNSLIFAQLKIDFLVTCIFHWKAWLECTMKEGLLVKLATTHLIVRFLTNYDVTKGVSKTAEY